MAPRSPLARDPVDPIPLNLSHIQHLCACRPRHISMARRRGRDSASSRMIPFDSTGLIPTSQGKSPALPDSPRLLLPYRRAAVGGM